MDNNSKFVLEERPETEVYATESDFIAIRQRDRREENLILLTADEAEKVMGYMRTLLAKIKKA